MTIYPYRENIKIKQIALGLKLKKRIFGTANIHSVLPCGKQVVFITSSLKNPNFYLYNIEKDTIVWANQLREDWHGTAEIYHFDNEMLLVSYASSAAHGRSMLLRYKMPEGDLINFVKIKGKFTNVILCKNNIVAGCRDGFIYLFDRELKLIRKFCVKDPNTAYGNAWAVPSPFDITTDKMNEYIAFSSYYSYLFLFDAKLNFIWNKNVNIPYRTHTLFAGETSRVFFSKNKNSLGEEKLYTKQRYAWAYQTLEIDSNSTKDQIKAAFRKKALEWHPDRHSFNNKKMAEEKFKKIVNAYELIYDAAEKEIDVELERMGITITVSVFDAIDKIEFLDMEDGVAKYIRTHTVNGNTVIVGIDGEYIEQQESMKINQLLNQIR